MCILDARFNLQLKFIIQLWNKNFTDFIQKEV